jgi:hypothetical protein
MQRFRGVARGDEPAAYFWSFRPEGREHDVSASFQRFGKLAYVSESAIGLGQKVEDCAIVPYIVSARRKRNFGYISDEPFDFF